MLHRARTLALAAALSVAAVPVHAADTTATTPSTPLGFTDVEGMLSTVFQREQSSFSGIGLRVHLHPERLMAGFSFVPSFEYWRNTNRLDAFGIKSTQSDATLGGEMRYTFPHEGFQPYLGAGWGVHFMSSKVNAPAYGLVNASDSVTKGALSALGGVTMPITARLSNVLEVKFHYLPRVSQTKLNYGLSYKL